jgi:hypothetical protein
LKLLSRTDRPDEVSGELVASTVEYDDERERPPFSETKHRVPIAVSEWCRRCHSSSELVSMIAGRRPLLLVSTVLSALPVVMQM